MTYKSRVDYTGTGSTTAYPIPFPYIKEGDVYLYQNGVLDTSSTVSWTNLSLVSVIPAPLSGATVEFRRQTVSTATLAQIQAGTILPSDINLDTLQLLYLIQEAQDQEVVDYSSANGILVEAQTLLAILQSEIGTVSGGVVAATMANLRALPLATIQGATKIDLLGYYAVGDGGEGTFVWNGTDSRSDDIGCIIQPTAVVSGNGRLNRLRANTALHTNWYGVKADSSTDNSTALAQMIVSAVNLGVYRIFVDACPGSSINFGTALTLQPKVIFMGAGKDISNLHFTATSHTTFAFSLLMPNGLADGTSDSPKFYDLSFIGNGFLKLNSPTGGFTNDNTTQKALSDCYIERCTIQAFNFNETDTIGLQLSKIAQPHIIDCTITGFGIHIDLEGCENPRITNNTMTGATLEFILAQTHSTFGNGLVVEANFMASILTGGNAFIVTSYNDIAIRDNWCEGAGNYETVFWLQQATAALAYVEDNWFDIPGSSVNEWIRVDDTTDGTTAEGYILISVTGNKGSLLTGNPGAANFNGHAGIAYFTGTSGVRRHVIHGHNVDPVGDIGWPCNSRHSTDGLMLSPNIVAYYSPNDDGLNNVSHGLTVKLSNGAFAPSLTGSSNYLDFGNSDRPGAVGVLSMYVLAYSPSGATVSSAITDAGSVVGSFGAQALTANSKPAWYKVVNGATTSTSAGARLYVSNADVRIYAVVLGQ